jgi:hypothetical protein
MRKIKLVVLFTSCLFFLTCAVLKERSYIRKGIIKSDLQQEAFLEEWGKPDRTYSILNDVGYPKGQIPIKVLVYENQNIELAFSEERLIGWRTIEEARQGRGFRFWTPTH